MHSKAKPLFPFVVRSCSIQVISAAFSAFVWQEQGPYRSVAPRGGGVKCVARGFGHTLNLKESFIGVQCCRECESTRSGAITPPNETRSRGAARLAKHSRCSGALQISPSPGPSRSEQIDPSAENSAEHA